MASGHGRPDRISRPTEATRVFTQVLHRRYAWYTLGLLCFIALMATLERMGWPRTWIGGTFLIGTVAVYAAIGLMSRTTDEAEYYVAGRRVPAIYNGMATAADWMSAASFIGTAGVLYLQGFAGLAYILGWTGGYCLVALLLAPYMRRLGFFTVPEFLGARYGGVLPRVVGVMAVVVVSFVYVVVQIYGVGLITSHLTGFSFEIGIFVGLGGVLVCSFLGGMRAVTWTQVAQYIVLIVAYLTPVFWLSINQTGSPFPLFSYGRQLEQVGLREQKLLDDPREALVRHQFAVRAEDARRKLADVPQAMVDDAETLSAHVRALQAADAPLARIQQAERRYLDRPRTVEEAEVRYRREAELSEERARPLGGMPRQAQAYPSRASATPATGAADAPTPPPPANHAAQRNFLALVLCLMLGTAAMPHVLTRYYTTPSATEARKSVGWSLFFIALLYLAAPALAVMVKYEVFTNLVGTPFDQLPGWIRRWSKLDSSLVSVEDINGDGLLQLAELKLAGDVIVLAAPEIGGLPLVVTYLVAAGGLAAALSTADGLLLTISNALSHDLYFGLVNPRAPAMRRVMLSKFLVLVIALLAAFIASMRLTDILQFVTAAFSLAASAFFPALVFGIFWGRANRIGATLGMLAGLGTCVAYMVVAHPLLRSFFGVTLPLEQARLLDVDAVAAGVFAVPVGALVLFVGSLLTAPPGAQQLALVERARNPDSESD
ncbi:VC_2705 family sodium/solute symporter [Leptothrix discophora]|uniref:VC_2705 family sodium/solute symporter n=1 Tax=Leptothrix discophora TaxID=89 RepID=A0ABT9G106_LEPDI|nr:VC_2705 family sodium/solute symporter [Leptothrix discophora]MDP4300174.1 VC_2705 family sodium/solute symporter [Leptothrix discophora]